MNVVPVLAPPMPGFGINLTFGIFFLLVRIWAEKDQRRRREGRSVFGWGLAVGGAGSGV